MFVTFGLGGTAANFLLMGFGAGTSTPVTYDGPLLFGAGGVYAPGGTAGVVVG